MPSPQAKSCRALPTHAIEMATLRVAFRLLQWLAIAILAVCLPLQAVSTSFTTLLGARHTHRQPVIEQATTSDPQDPLCEWREWQMQYGDAHRGDAHERAHALGLRHHHLPGDPSVVPDDASDMAGDAFPSDTVQASASFLFMATGSAADLPLPSEAFGAPWRASGSVRPRSPHPWRIERPPQLLPPLPSLRA